MLAQDAQLRAATEAMQDVLSDALVALYLHGSAVSGGPRPHSDVDLLAVVDRPTTGDERDGLLSALLTISGRHPARPGGARPVELILFLTSDLAPPAVPARAEFVYGEWLRDGFARGARPLPLSDPEHTLVLAQARQQAQTLLGPPAADLLPGIPAPDVRSAMRDALPALLHGLPGDERNVLLTLARMWRTATTGEFVTKDEAAAWASSKMPGPEAAALTLARDGYLGTAGDDWTDHQASAERTAEFLQGRVSALL